MTFSSQKKKTHEALFPHPASIDVFTFFRSFLSKLDVKKIGPRKEMW